MPGARDRVALALALACLVAAGCGGGSASVDRPDSVDLDLTVPEGVETLVRLRPRALLASDETSRVVTAIVPEERLDAFSSRHGVDPRAAELIVHASYPRAGSVVLVEGPFHARVVVGEIGHRMAPLESSTDEPEYRRAGIYQRHRFELITLGPHALAMVDGPPALSGLVLHTRDAARVAPTEAPSRLRSIVAAERDSPFLLVRHGRPDDLPPQGVGLLLARLEDASLAISPAGSAEPGALELRVRLFGEFPPGADENFRALIAGLSEDDLGRAIGLEEVARSLAIEVLPLEIRFTARVRASTLARGLRVLVGAEIDELLDDVSGT